jgi:hypothetical protein
VNRRGCPPVGIRAGGAHVACISGTLDKAFPEISCLDYGDRLNVARSPLLEAIGETMSQPRQSLHRNRPELIPRRASVGTPPYT